MELNRRSRIKLKEHNREKRKNSRKTPRSYAFQFILIWFKCITTADMHSKRIAKNASIPFAKYSIFHRVVQIKLSLCYIMKTLKMEKSKLIEKMNQSGLRTLFSLFLSSSCKKEMRFRFLRAISSMCTYMCCTQWRFFRSNSCKGSNEYYVRLKQP